MGDKCPTVRAFLWSGFSLASAHYNSKFNLKTKDEVLGLSEANKSFITDNSEARISPKMFVQALTLASCWEPHEIFMLKSETIVFLHLILNTKMTPYHWKITTLFWKSYSFSCEITYPGMVKLRVAMCDLKAITIHLHAIDLIFFLLVFILV